MTNTYGPQLSKYSSPSQIVSSIYYWINETTWAPGIAFPAGPNDPTTGMHDQDLFFNTTVGHLKEYQEDEWVDLGEAANAITWCGTTVPSNGTGSNFALFNKYDSGEIYQKIDNVWRHVGSNKNGLPLSADAINFTDSARPWRSVNLGLIMVRDDGDAPLLATDQGLVVKKDIAAGGFLSSNQGALMLGSGLNNKSDVPKIVLIHTGAFGTQDTLYLKQFDGSSAHLDLGNLTVHGHLGVGDTVTSSLNPDPGLGLGNPTNRWQGIVVETAYLNTISPIPAPYGNGSYINITGTIKSGVNGVGYRSYYGGGGGGANGGIYLNEYGWARFDGGAGSVFWKVLTSAGSEVLAVPNATGAGVAIWLSCSMNPNGAGVLGCGSGSSYWAGVVAYRYYGKITTIGYFDTLDDLGLIKNYKATKNEEGKDVIDFSTLEFLKADDDDKKRDFYDVGKLHGFTFGCIKALVKRVEALEEQLSRNQTTAWQTNTSNTEAEGA